MSDTETNFDGGIFDCESFDNRYNVYRRDRETSCSLKNSGGGILVAVKNNINVIRQTCWESRVEDIWLSIMPPRAIKPSLHVFLCYLPSDLPIEDLTVFYISCQDIILKSPPNDVFLVLGDFNTVKHYLGET
jgi:hypothetical protein